MVRKRRSKTDSYDDASGNMRITKKNSMYDSFTREDVAVHREINQYTVNLEQFTNSRIPEVKKEVLEKFVRMPRKIITRSMLTFINSSSDSGSTSKSLNIKPTSPFFPSLNHSPSPGDPEPIDPRSSGEASEIKSNMQGLAKTSSMDLRQTFTSSPIPLCVQNPEPIDPRSFGEAFMVKRVVANVPKPDTWNMASITQVLSGFGVESSISPKPRNPTFGRSTFTMTGNSLLSSRLHRSKLTELPHVVSGKPPPSFQPPSNIPPMFHPISSSPPKFFPPPTIQTAPSFQQNVQPSLQSKTYNPSNSYIGSMVSETSNGLRPDQESTESTYAGTLWNLINHGWTHLSDSFIKIMWGSLSALQFAMNAFL